MEECSSVTEKPLKLQIPPASLRGRQGAGMVTSWCFWATRAKAAPPTLLECDTCTEAAMILQKIGLGRLSNTIRTASTLDDSLRVDDVMERLNSLSVGAFALGNNDNQSLSPANACYYNCGAADSESSERSEADTIQSPDGQIPNKSGSAGCASTSIVALMKHELSVAACDTAVEALAESEMGQPLEKARNRMLTDTKLSTPSADGIDPVLNGSAFKLSPLEACMAEEVKIELARAKNDIDGLRRELQTLNSFVRRNPGECAQSAATGEAPFDSAAAAGNRLSVTTSDQGLEQPELLSLLLPQAAKSVSLQASLSQSLTLDDSESSPGPALEVPAAWSTSSSPASLLATSHQQDTLTVSGEDTGAATGAQGQHDLAHINLKQGQAGALEISTAPTQFQCTSPGQAKDCIGVEFVRGGLRVVKAGFMHKGGPGTPGRPPRSPLTLQHSCEKQTESFTPRSSKLLEEISAGTPAATPRSDSPRTPQGCWEDEDITLRSLVLDGAGVDGITDGSRHTPPISPDVVGEGREAGMCQWTCQFTWEGEERQRGERIAGVAEQGRGLVKQELGRRIRLLEPTP